MMIDLKFIKSWGAYNAGETARFVPELAQVLMKKGIADQHSLNEPDQAQASEQSNPGRPILTTVRPDDRSKSLGK